MTEQKQTTAVAKASQPMAVFKAVLNAESVQEQFKNALGERKNAFVASLIDLFGGDKQLQTCKPADVVKEALRAATLNLPINKSLGFAYVVVFNNNVKDEHGNWHKVPTPTFVPGYKGYIQLAMRTGQYRTLNADVVYEGELVKGSKLTGEVSLDGEKKSDKIIGYFCYFELLNGFRKTLYMSLEEMAKYAIRYSPSVPKNTKVEDLIAAANSGEVGKKVGWMGNFNDMAVKTVVRRLISKYGYLSVEMQDAVNAENKAESEATRDEIIAENANKTVINVDATDYEEVDTETGEVTTTAAKKTEKLAGKANIETIAKVKMDETPEELPY